MTKTTTQKIGTITVTRQVLTGEALRKESQRMAYETILKNRKSA